MAESFPHILEHPGSVTMWSYWSGLNAGRMPSARDWDPVRIPKLMPWCTIFERGGETGFRIRFAGTAICDFYGFEMTGNPVGRIAADNARDQYLDSIEEALARPCGRLTRIEGLSNMGKVCQFEVLSLPLSDDDGSALRLVNHQAIVDTITYGDARSEFSRPSLSVWLDIGAGVPENGNVRPAKMSEI